MSITRSVEFYAGKKCVPTKSLFGSTFLNYEFYQDIAYKDISFSDMAIQLREFMENHDIKIGYCDISADFGGGYSLFKRYIFINKKGKFITKKQKYEY